MDKPKLRDYHHDVNQSKVPRLRRGHLQSKYFSFLFSQAYHYRHQHDSSSASWESPYRSQNLHEARAYDVFQGQGQ